MKKLIFLLFLIPLYVNGADYKAFSNDSILYNINEFRSLYGLSSLSKNETLCKLANTRAEEIRTDWSHGQFQTELNNIDGMEGEFYENLARTFEPKDVVWAWSMSTMSHREAMLIPDMKYGCVAQIGDYYAFEGYISR